MKRFEIKIPAERDEELQAVADRAGVSKAALVKLALSEWLDHRAVLPSSQERAA